MAQFDQKYALNIRYLTDISGAQLSHRHRLPVVLGEGQADPPAGSDPANVIIETNGTGGTPGTASVEQFASDYVAAWLAMSGTNVSVTSVVFSSYPNGFAGSEIFVAPLDVTDTGLFASLVGSGTSAAEGAQQTTFSFYNNGGKTSRVVVVEHRAVTEAVNNIATISGDIATFVSFILGASSAVRGTNGEKLTALYRVSNTQNSGLARLRFRG